MNATKKPRSASQIYAFRYWRRGYRARGLHLDRLAGANTIQCVVSGGLLFPCVTLHPGVILEQLRRGEVTALDL